METLKLVLNLAVLVDTKGLIKDEVEESKPKESSRLAVFATDCSGTLDYPPEYIDIAHALIPKARHYVDDAPNCWRCAVILNVLLMRQPYIEPEFKSVVLLSVAICFAEVFTKTWEDKVRLRTIMDSRHVAIH